MREVKVISLCAIPVESDDALEAFAVERERQIHEKGYTTSHDDEHVKGEIASAAAWWAIPPEAVPEASDYVWPSDWSVPEMPLTPTISERKRQLAKAGALLMAEWERLTRLEKSQGMEHAP